MATSFAVIAPSCSSTKSDSKSMDPITLSMLLSVPLPPPAPPLINDDLMNAGDTTMSTSASAMESSMRCISVSSATSATARSELCCCGGDGGKNSRNVDGVPSAVASTRSRACSALEHPGGQWDASINCRDAWGRDSSTVIQHVQNAYVRWHAVHGNRKHRSGRTSSSTNSTAPAGDTDPVAAAIFSIGATEKTLARCMILWRRASLTTARTRSAVPSPSKAALRAAISSGCMGGVVVTSNDGFMASKNASASA